MKVLLNEKKIFLPDALLLIKSMKMDLKLSLIS